MENQAIVQSVDQNNLQSRWGHHPCNRETFLKLKSLHKAFWHHVRRYAAYERWEAKTVYQHGPAPQYFYPFAVGKMYEWRTSKDGTPQYGLFRNVENHPVRKLFQQARMPSAEPVKAFDAATLQKIDTWLADLARFEVEKVT